MVTNSMVKMIHVIGEKQFSPISWAQIWFDLSLAKLESLSENPVTWPPLSQQCLPMWPPGSIQTVTWQHAVWHLTPDTARHWSTNRETDLLEARLGLQRRMFVIHVQVRSVISFIILSSIKRRHMGAWLVWQGEKITNSLVFNNTSWEQWSSFPNRSWDPIIKEKISWGWAVPSSG